MPILNTRGTHAIDTAMSAAMLVVRRPSDFQQSGDATRISVGIMAVIIIVPLLSFTALALLIFIILRQSRRRRAANKVAITSAGVYTYAHGGGYNGAYSALPNHALADAPVYIDGNMSAPTNMQSKPPAYSTIAESYRPTGQVPVEVTHNQQTRGHY